MDPGGHLQATGRDARGRKQYRYHARWSDARDRDKYDRMVLFARTLPLIRRRVRAHLRREGLCRERSLAAVVSLLDRTLVRVGNSEYARDNQSFGLTTLRREHVTVRGDAIVLSFTGKSGKAHEVAIRDAALARVVCECLALPGREVFKYRNGGGRVCDVTAGDVNAYLREIAAGDFTAKDFRTWAASVTVVRELLRSGSARTQHLRKASLLAALDVAAARLNNTRAICRRSYVHPAIAERWLAAGRLDAGGPRHDRAAARRALSRLLHLRAAL